MLKMVDRGVDAIFGAMAELYRGVLIARSLLADEAGTGKLAFIQAHGRGDPDATDPNDHELVQEADLDHISHFGFDSSPPVDTELVIVDLDGGEAVIGERDSVSTNVPDRLIGDTAIYDAGDQYIHLDQDSKITIKSPVGNVEIIAKAGSQVKIGHDGATYRDIAYAHTTQAGASQVAVGTGLKTWMDKVDVDLAAIKSDVAGVDALLGAAGTNTANIVAINAWILAHQPNTPGGPVGPTLGPPGAKTATTLGPTTAALAVDTDHSYVSSGSTKAEVEP